MFTRILAFLIGAAPLAFGVIRAITRSDFRYLWVAIATSLAVAIVMKLGRATTRTAGVLSALALLAFCLATPVGVYVASLTGTSAPVVWLVTGAFAFCGAASGFLAGTAGPRVV